MKSEQVTYTIDSYSFVHNLIDAGFTENQAKTVLDEIKKIQFTNVASKDDMATLKEDISTFRVEVANQIKELHQGLVKWLIPMILGLYAFLAAMFIKH